MKDKMEDVKQKIKEELGIEELENIEIVDEKELDEYYMSIVKEKYGNMNEQILEVVKDKMIVIDIESRYIIDVEYNGKTYYIIER